MCILLARKAMENKFVMTIVKNSHAISIIYNQLEHEGEHGRECCYGFPRTDLG